MNFIFFFGHRQPKRNKYLCTFLFEFPLFSTVQVFSRYRWSVFFLQRYNVMGTEGCLFIYRMKFCRIASIFCFVLCVIFFIYLLWTFFSSEWAPHLHNVFVIMIQPFICIRWHKEIFFFSCFKIVIIHLISVSEYIHFFFENELIWVALHSNAVWCTHWLPVVLLLMCTMYAHHSPCLLHFLPLFRLPLLTHHALHCTGLVVATARLFPISTQNLFNTCYVYVIVAWKKNYT